MSTPNVIFIIADQMRGDCLGCDGNGSIETPNLDYLASAGTRFCHAYSAVPSCLPARATIWSGCNQWHTGVLGMGAGQGPTPNDFPHTIAGEFSAAGYRTHLVGKGHFSPQRAMMGFQSHELDESGRVESAGFKNEYRHWFEQARPNPYITPDDHGIDWNSYLSRPWHTEEHLHPTAWTMSRALAFLDQRDRRQPFFLNISFARPHSPYVPPEPYFDMYIDGTTPAPYVGDWAEMHDDCVTALDVNAWRGKMSERRIHRARAGYYGEISFIDTQIGRLLQWCQRNDRQAYENTWFVFVSDHGDMQGDHHLWRKTYAYEGSVRVPFIVVPPAGLSLGVQRVAEEPVELQDLMPTLLEAAGLACPSAVDGRSVLPIMKGEEVRWRDYVHGEHCRCYSPEQEMQYVTDGKRKYIWLPRIDVEQFFDLEADPGECSNLINAAERSSEVQLWRQRLVDELAGRDCGWVRDGALHCPDDTPLVSPYKNVRWQG